MKDLKKIIADKLKFGEYVGLYCYGIYASHILYYLEKFHNVLPTVIIDNDVSKKGKAEFDIPVMPFMESKKLYPNLQYFICSDDFKYTIIADMINNGIKPENIINYVLVEKRKTCLYFENRLLPLFSALEDKSQMISHCNADSFKADVLITKIPYFDEGYSEFSDILQKRANDFYNDKIELCKTCVLNHEQNIVAKEYKNKYQQLCFYQQTCADCVVHCKYCCVGGADKNVKSKPIFRLDYIDLYNKFIDEIIKQGSLSDDFNCAIDLSERYLEEKIKFVVDSIERNHLLPMVYKINSCLLTYSETLANLLKNGMAYIIWSLDAGTRETYHKIKQVDGFNTVIDNVKKLISIDAFNGRFIVPKYVITKDINDNEKEFNEFIKLTVDLGLKFVSLSFDFKTKADEKDNAFIRSCYKKIIENGLQLTYKNNSIAVTRALSMNSILEQEK